jgi:hypothetical protein
MHEIYITVLAKNADIVFLKLAIPTLATELF